MSLHEYSNSADSSKTVERAPFAAAKAERTSMEEREVYRHDKQFRRQAQGR